MVPGQHDDLFFCEPLLARICAIDLCFRVDVCLFQPSPKRFRIDLQEFLALMEIVFSVHLCLPPV